MAAFFLVRDLLSCCRWTITNKNPPFTLHHLDRRIDQEGILWGSKSQLLFLSVSDGIYLGGVGFWETGEYWDFTFFYFRIVYFSKHVLY